MTAPPGYAVAFFTNTFYPFISGVALSIDRYRRHLKALGDRVVVYAPQYEEPLEDTDEIRRLPAIKQFLHTDFALPLPVSFKPLLDFRNEDFDVVHVHHPFLLGETGMRLARQHGLPLVLTYHTQYERYTHYVPVDDAVAARTIIRHTTDFCNLCDLVIAPTRDIECVLRDRGVQSRIEVLPTGVEVDRFAQADPEAARQRLQIDASAHVLLYVGRLVTEKNLEYLVRACLRVLEAEQNAHLVIVGDGQNRHALIGLARERRRTASRVHFPGQVTGADLEDLYAAATLFVFASKTETQGVVVAEAMAAGTPVVALDADGVRGLVRDGLNGRLLPEEASETDFADAVLDALRDHAERSAWIPAARKTARELNMPCLARQLHELYGSLKLLPKHELKRDTMSFGLIRNYFETVWEQLSQRFMRI